MTKEKKYDTIVYIGRFQPVHNAHIATIRRAAKIANKVIVIIGSANQARCVKNPFTGDERELMLEASIEPLRQYNTLTEFVIRRSENYMYSNETWAKQIQSIVATETKEKDRVGIIGHMKDSTSFYLTMFPQWDFVEMPLIEPLDATQIRNMYFNDSAQVNFNFFTGVLPAATITFLENFYQSDSYFQIVYEMEFISNYKKQYEGLPFPPIFVTVDSVFFHKGHVLLIKRRAFPGKGLWALPGGFVDAASDYSVEDAMIRELKEETGIKIPEKVLRGSIKDSKVFDAPERSTRGRTITHAFMVRTDWEEFGMPRVKGGDDAEKAKWIPISELKREQVYEDHFDIIMYFLSKA